MGILRRVLEASGTTAAAVGRLHEGKTIAEFKGVDKKLLGAIYALGHQHYSNENFQTARSILRYLCVHDHRNPEYLAALGACEIRLHNYKTAQALLERAVDIDNQDPRSMFNLALSLLKNGDKRQGKMAMQYANELAAGKDAFVFEWRLSEHILKRSSATTPPGGES